jgi:hypothetical protein
MFWVQDDLEYSWAQLNYLIDNAPMSKELHTYLLFVRAMRLHQSYMLIWLMGIALMFVSFPFEGFMHSYLYWAGSVTWVGAWLFTQRARKEYQKYGDLLEEMGAYEEEEDGQ